MTNIFSFVEGDVPLLVSIPHDGELLEPGMRAQMTATGLSTPDRDWHVKELYDFVSALRASTITANYSRYVVDLNRASTDEVLYTNTFTTGVCPITTFTGEQIYQHSTILDGAAKQRRIDDYWTPYHNKISEELTRLKARFGYAILWDAHSIRSEVPTLFDGVLADLNFGSNSGASCDQRLQERVLLLADQSKYSVDVNGRFKGGFITRNYGTPKDGVHAIQMELSQHNYMNEQTREYEPVLACQLKEVLRAMLEELIKQSHKWLAQ